MAPTSPYDNKGIRPFLKNAENEQVHFPLSKECLTCLHSLPTRLTCQVTAAGVRTATLAGAEPNLGLRIMLAKR